MFSDKAEVVLGHVVGTLQECRCRPDRRCRCHPVLMGGAGVVLMGGAGVLTGSAGVTLMDSAGVTLTGRWSEPWAPCSELNQVPET